MIIFHSIHDKESRNFIANNSDGNLVINWYDPNIQKKYVSFYDHPQVRDFPAVFIFIPEYKTEPVTNIDGDIEGEGEVIPAHTETFYPVTIEDINNEISRINLLLQASRDLGYTDTGDDISIASISSQDEEYRTNIFG